ncbi:hypothetical protein RCO28_36670 [Streptomyces sp. LHD-70]|uniref:hypothetical protein n=1 Tax=Streptomyces sp. LHD-70 TaxID=3072140 RepID=UPI00280DBDBF|nr:hypothetical protein [Streptomyces sp. LHD-70]MDQ8707961.1 hypothetical protein [Streptomyces sp. LHD-70]
MRADAWFVCPAGHELHPDDVDLDGVTEWAVDPSGTLGYVTEPAYALACLTDTLDELDDADHQGWIDMATHDAFTASCDYVTAYDTGLRPYDTTEARRWFPRPHSHQISPNYPELADPRCPVPAEASKALAIVAEYLDDVATARTDEESAEAFDSLYIEAIAFTNAYQADDGDPSD